MELGSITFFRISKHYVAATCIVRVYNLLQIQYFGAFRSIYKIDKMLVVTNLKINQIRENIFPCEWRYQNLI